MIEKFLPFLGWFEDYDRKSFQADLIAGLTVALVLIPQSMAYAQLAGLPAYYGLYAAFLPPMIASLFGSSRQLATGPVAVVSLMTAASLEPLATAGSASFIAYAVMLALIVGLFQLLLGVLRLGLVVNFLSHPVVNGFTNAAAIIIATSQLSKVFGVEVEKAAYHYETIMRVLNAAWEHTHWPTFGMALLAIAIMAGLKRVNPRIPNVLVAVAFCTVLSWAVGFQKNVEVPLTNIASKEMHDLVSRYNSEIAALQEVGERRARINQQLNSLKGKNSPPLEILEGRHQLALLNLTLDELKADTQTMRGSLREIVLVAQVGPGGERIFYPVDSLPEGSKSDGPLWRVRVKNSSVDQERVLLSAGGSVVGNIPAGLPQMSIPGLDWNIMVQLLPYAMIIALLGFMEAISIARAMAARTGHKLDPNQELIGQGLANIVGSLGNSYPVSGSFSRSAVCLQAGGVTGFSNVISSLIVVVTLLFLTPLLYHLPQAVLACVIMMAVIGLINIKGFVHTWKIQRSDGIISVITFVGTLVFAPHLDKGILIGVVLSAALFIYGRMRPKVTALSMGPDGVLESAADNQLQLCRHIAAVRFEGSLFFANASYLDEQIFRIRSANKELRHIMLVADGINDLDSSGEDALELLTERLHSAGLGFSMCRVKEEVLKVMERSGLVAKIGEENIYPSASLALPDIIKHIHDNRTGKPCGNCPMTAHIPS